LIVLTILGVIGILIAVLFAILQYNEHCTQNYGYKFIYGRIFLYYTGLAILAIVGQILYERALTHNGDIWNGLILLGLALLGFLRIAFNNIKKTRLTTGILGTSIQLTLFIVLFPFIFLFFIMTLLAGLALKTPYKNIDMDDPYIALQAGRYKED
jgi:ACR3 family arsenite efflux pump ArsB